MRLLAQLAGDVPELAAAELRAVFDAHGAPLTALRSEPRFLDAHADLFLDDALAILRRVGLTQYAAMHLFDGVPGAWSEGARECCFPAGIPFAARATKVDPDAPWDGPAIEREVGALLATPSRPVNLSRPGLVARAFVLRDRVYVGQQLWEWDPKALAARHVDERPFFSPVSLDPRLARALVNVVGVRPGQRIYDPFCGTGGTLIEAAEMGIEAVGSDLDPEMAAGTEANLGHFGLKGTVFACDVSAAPGELAARGIAEVDGVASDLPYGRSSWTGKEEIQALYARGLEAIARVLKPGGRAVVGMADPGATDRLPPALERVDVFRVRAHKSLTRHFVLLRKRSA